MYVFYLLAFLTVLELAVIYLPISKIIIGILLVGLALGKAALVALYFMHLKFEKTTLGVIALTPLILCTLLIVALLPDLTGATRQSKTQKTVKAETVVHMADVNDSPESVSD
jgi:cytochrome c oxidase subunit 4